MRAGGRLFLDCRGLAIVRVVRAVVVVAMLAFPAAGQESEPSAADAYDDERAEPRAALEGPKLTALLHGLDERVELIKQQLSHGVRVYREASIRRAEATRQLSLAEDALDRELVRARESNRARLDELFDRVHDARGELSAARDRCDRLAGEISSLVAEREVITQRVAELRGSRLGREEPLTGTWQVSWMPGGIGGTFYLDQSGTLVTGQYRLSNGMAGSLQGTFVNGKLYLQRIDSVRGRDAEIEGYLESDGTRLRGTWQNFELVQGGLPRGQWTARRVP